MANNYNSYNNNFQFTLPTYPTVFMNIPKNIEDGDKIILPEKILFQLMHGLGSRKKLPHPMIYKMTNLKNKMIIYCGVLEYSSVEDRAYISQWQMDCILLEPGDMVNFSLCENLPMLNYVCFKPQTQKYLIDFDDPKSILENALRKFTVLTLQSTIEINSSNEKYIFHVVKINPSIGSPPAGCIVDSDLKVEFNTPFENNKENELSVEISLNIEINAKIEANTFKYYKINVRNVTDKIIFLLKSEKGDPDMYISTKISKPTITSHEWSANLSNSNPKKIEIKNDREKSENKWYYIGIHSYKNSSEFSLIVKKDEIEGKNKIKSYSMNNSKDETNNPNYKRCENCLQYTLKSSFELHKLRCKDNIEKCDKCEKVLSKRQKKNHWHCDICNEIMRQEDIVKHKDLIHKEVSCRCGSKITPLKLKNHQNNECKYRRIKCKFCKVLFTFGELKKHEIYCGSRTYLCELCHKHIQFKNKEKHVEDHKNNKIYLEEEDVSISSIVDEETKQLNKAILNSLNTNSKEEKVHFVCCPYCKNKIPIEIDIGNHMLLCNKSNVG